MLPLKKALTSSLGKKYLMAASGIALVGFLVTHLAANLLLYLPEGELYNGYAKALHDWGPLLIVAELGLGGLFLFHAAVATGLHMKTAAARQKGYLEGQRSKGGNSRFGFPANKMIWSGGILFAFLVLHIIHFRFGPGIAEGYEAMVNGESARDLHRLVAEEFRKAHIALPYAAVMLFLGAHLRHGFWSWLQSLGAMAPKYDKIIYSLGLLVALAFALGFLGIPFWYLLDVPGMLK